MFLGLFCAQGMAALAAALLVALACDPKAAPVALWGGSISLFANTWAGFQLWLHPGNRSPQRRTGAAIRAEAGKVAIVLVLFWLTLEAWPQTRTGSTAITLLLTFLWTYLVGLFWLQRETGRTGEKI